MVRIGTDGDDPIDLRLFGGPDTVFGLDGNDIISSFEATATVSGPSLIFGNEDEDSLTSRASQDTLYGGQDDDTLVSEEGGSIFFGDLGDDQFSGTGGNDIVFGDTSTPGNPSEDGDDTIDFSRSRGNNIGVGQGGDDLITASPSGKDTLYGGQGDDTLDAKAATDGRNLLYGDKGADVLYGGGDRDSLYGENAINEIPTAKGGQGDAGAGDDTLFAAENSSRNWMKGGGGKDVLIAGGGEKDTLFGGSGDDSLDSLGSQSWGFGNAGNDTITAADAAVEVTLYGGQGNDSLTTTNEEGFSLLYGDKGNDILVGTTSDTLYGDEGNDNLSGSAFMFGGVGNDTLNTGGASNASLDGGEGADRLIADSTGNTLVGGAGNDVLDARGGGGSNRLVGGDGNDILFSGGEDILIGGAGSDRYIGSDQADTLRAEAGDRETLQGGGDRDRLIGNKGAFDGFVYLGGSAAAKNTELAEGQGDVITGFDSGTDKIYLAKSGFTGLGQIGGGLAANVDFFVLNSGTYGGSAEGAGFNPLIQGQTAAIVFERSSGKLYYDANIDQVGTGGSANAGLGLDLFVIADTDSTTFGQNDIVLF